MGGTNVQGGREGGREGGWVDAGDGTDGDWGWAWGEGELPTRGLVNPIESGNKIWLEARG